eukprot:1536679-Pyramimonas_sp.AAC.1
MESATVALPRPPIPDAGLPEGLAVRSNNTHVTQTTDNQFSAEMLMLGIVDSLEYYNLVVRTWLIVKKYNRVVHCAALHLETRVAQSTAQETLPLALDDLKQGADRVYHGSLARFAATVAFAGVALASTSTDSEFRSGYRFTTPSQVALCETSETSTGRQVCQNEIIQWCLAEQLRSRVM